MRSSQALFQTCPGREPLALAGPGTLLVEGTACSSRRPTEIWGSGENESTETGGVAAWEGSTHTWRLSTSTSSQSPRCRHSHSAVPLSELPPPPWSWLAGAESGPRGSAGAPCPWLHSCEVHLLCTIFIGVSHMHQCPATKEATSGQRLSTGSMQSLAPKSWPGRAEEM